MINIFGVIGAEVRAVDVIKQIQSVEGDSIDVVISSPGGSVFEGMAIYDALKASGKEINTSILGLGASIASVIFMAGNKREMGEGSQLMIHNALTTQGGNKHELSEAIDRLDSIDAQMSKIYINATGMDEGTVAEMLKNETFMSADEAIEKGFATGKTNSMEMVAIYNKQTEAIMPKEEKEDKAKSLMAHIASFFKAEDKAEEVKDVAMDEEEKEEPKAMEEEEEKPSEEAMDEEEHEEKAEDEEEPSEVEALKAQIEKLEGELKAKHDAEFVAKSNAIFEAIADNRLTLAQGKDLALESGDVVTEKLQGLEANATGYGRKDDSLSNKPVECVLAKYEALAGSDKTSYFNAHKEEILIKMKQEL
jgi:ATP-dependent Clp endopeptidase proteolytic subunit ClpP